jgi:hypothetical protein
MVSCLVVRLQKQKHTFGDTQSVHKLNVWLEAICLPPNRSDLVLKSSTVSKPESEESFVLLVDFLRCLMHNPSDFGNFFRV